jgi:hypothetical protein
MEDDRYISIQKTFVERGFLAVMNKRSLKVYFALCSFKDWKTGNCWPTLSKLCEVTGISRTHVIEATHELEELGLVKSWLNRREGSRMFKKFYHIIPIEEVSPQNVDAYRKLHSPQNVNVYPRKRDKKGRFQKSESPKRGRTESPKCGRTESPKRGRELISLNNLTEQSQRINKDSLSFIDEKEGKKKGDLTLEDFQASVEAWGGDERKARDYWRKRGVKLPC